MRLKSEIPKEKAEVYKKGMWKALECANKKKTLEEVTDSFKKENTLKDD